MANKKNEFSLSLQDIPVEYLTEKCQWQDYKRMLIDLGLQWNLPDWSTTIIHSGRDWDEMVSAGADLKKIFPLPKMGVFVDGKVEAIEMNLIQMLGLPTSRNEKKSSSHFCNLGTCELESDKKLPARQKFWNWMVKSLKSKNCWTILLHSS